MAARSWQQGVESGWKPRKKLSHGWQGGENKRWWWQGGEEGDMA
jgi:hypothetical protein